MHDAVNWQNFKSQIISAFAVRPEIVRSCYYNYQPDRRKGEKLAALVDRIANDLNSYTETGVMPESEKLEEVQRLIARMLPNELHFGLPPTIGNLQDLTTKLEARTGRIPYLKLTSQDITNEWVENKPWTFNEKSTVNAVSNSTAAPPAANSATSNNSVVPPNPPPPTAKSNSCCYGSATNNSKCRKSPSLSIARKFLMSKEKGQE